MTLHEVTTQLFNLSIDGFFNREKFTLQRLQDYISAMTQGEEAATVTMEIALPDGWWYFTVSKLPQFGRGFYDYTIPDNREDEAHIKSRLFSNS